MATTSIDARISRLLNDLEMPDLDEAEIRRIKDKIKFLQDMK